MLDSSSESNEFNVEKIKELELKINQLCQSQEHFQQITDNIKEVFFLIDSNTDGIFYVSPAYEKVWGRSCESLYQDPQSWLLAIHPDDCSQAMGSLETQFRTGEEFQEEYRIIRPDGTICWVRVKAFPIRNEQDKVNRFVGIAEDITKRKETEIALKQSEEHFKLIFEQASIGIAVTDLSGRFEKINPAFCDILEYTESDLLNAQLLDILQSDNVTSHESIIDNLLRSSLSKVQLEVQCKTRTHKIIDVILKAVVIYDELEEPINFQFQLLDISDRKKMERQLVYDALHDPLTQLPNRVLFTDRLDQAIARNRVHENYRYAVLFLDIDRFKIINDGLGHLSGDKLLVLVAQRLVQTVKKTDTIARFGGDEFTILLDDIVDYSVATEMAEQLQKVLRDHFEIDGNRVFVSASIGITLSSYDYEKADDVIRDADATMYKAKDRGRARYEVFDQSLRSVAMDRLRLETEVRLGIARKEFVLFYQPIIDINTFSLKGLEALVRWQHPKQGLIGPYSLIPVAEETGLIIELGEIIFDMACRQLMEWHQAQLLEVPNFRLSINLSGKQLMSPELLSMIKRSIAQGYVDPRKIKLEITESILLEQDYQAIHVLNNLRDYGFEISLDDFGTGYSSLSYLQRLPIDTLKIDRSFIQKMQNDVKQKNFAIVQSIITLSHALGLDVIAEGVETREQLEKLQSLKCEYVQGYLFSPPVNAAAATEFLKARIIEI